MRLAIACVMLVACGGGGTGTDSDPMPDSSTPNDFETLMQGDWSLPPGGDGYFCVYVTLTKDIDVSAFRPLAPPGTHHTVLTRFKQATPADGTYPCNVGTNGPNMVFGSGVGAPDFTFPDGIGLHLGVGQRLLLNLHLYNATDQPLSGKSGVLVKAATAAAPVTNYAEMVLAGPTISLSVPPGTSTQQGVCNISNISAQPIQVFALSQHMHKLGTHQKSVVTRSGSPDIVLQDEPYNFEDQKFHHTTSLVELRGGDVLTTYCSYSNTTGSTVTFGESSNDEMCFTDLYYYPAKNANYICTN